VIDNTRIPVQVLEVDIETPFLRERSPMGCQGPAFDGGEAALETKVNVFQSSRTRTAFSRAVTAGAQGAAVRTIFVTVSNHAASWRRGGAFL
jgi:hypothetical protein